MAKKNRETSPNMRKNAVVTAIVNLFAEVPNKLLNYKQLSHALGMRTDAQKQLVVEALNTLLEQGQLEQVSYDSYRDWETDRKSTRLNSSHRSLSRMPSSA